MMIWPLASTAWGMNIVSPISRVMRSAMLVLPLPGNPKKKIDAPELTAGPIWLNIDSEMTRSSKAF